MMTLAQLIVDLPVEAPPTADLGAIRVQGLSHDSRRVEAGDLFVTWRGERFDGRRYLRDAIERGAVAVLLDRVDRGSGPRVSRGRPVLVASQPQRLLAPLASKLYDHPDRKMRMVGVTGTNGKTSVALMIAGLLEAAGLACGTMGTLGYRFRELELEQSLGLGGGRTTPEASDLVRGLEEMRQAGAQAVAMEVSSHSLSLGRVAGLSYDAAIFTNLSRDHLDFHADLEDYFAAKAALFDQVRSSGVAIVGIGDAFGRRLAQRLSRRRFTYGPGGAFELIDLQATPKGIRARVTTPDGSLDVVSPLVGRFHAENLLAAVACAIALGVDPETVESALPEIGTIAGRMEPVDVGQRFPVFVDYAHTEEALRAALSSLRELWPGRIAVVFGCGGERDRGKRPAMGRVAAELADRVIVTDDNPRDEEPAAIHRDILGGIPATDLATRKRAAKVEVVASRIEAIGRSLQLAHAEGDWAVLIAGKGHESSQTIGGQELPFSDRDVARQGLGELLGSSKAR